MKIRFITAAVAALLCIPASADEGMWMVHALNKAVETDMRARGCRLSPGEIYNCDAPGTALCDAVVSLDFACTGSMISDEGLLITNHHCAFADIHAMSTPEHNYLENGFWAMLDSEEAPVPGKNALFLRRVIDVTEEVAALTEELQRSGKPSGSRKIAHIMQQRYEGNGLNASLESMWAGSKYYICLYEVYKDIRLVAAPPVSIAAFGGDIDNWDWPQHKCDFAIYRIYTAPDGSPAEYSPENVPLKPGRKLDISLKGYNEGDFTMVIGYPGITHRYNSSYKVAFEQDVTMPVSVKVRAENMRIIKEAMDSDPAVRLKYSERFFSLSNVQELEEGTIECYKRFDVAGEKRELEKQLAEWIDADPARASQWGSLLDGLEESYRKICHIKHDETWFRECMVRGSSMFLMASRLNGRINQNWKSFDKLFASIDCGVERKIFRNCLELYYENICDHRLGDWQRELKVRFGNNYDAMCAYLWDKSLLTDPKRFEAVKQNRDLCEADPLFRFYNDLKVLKFHKEEQCMNCKDVHSLGHEYIRALYAMREDKGIMQYPDANSTMRLTYGTVGSLYPKDGVVMGWKSSTRGILEKHNPADYDFCLKTDWQKMLELNAFCNKYNWSGEVDFLSDNDITGGNSGSPVLDADGRLIGLAFDGNKESLAGDSSFTRDYNKCINVDIRYVLYVLGEYAGMQRIIDELTLVR